VPVELARASFLDRLDERVLDEIDVLVVAHVGEQMDDDCLLHVASLLSGFRPG
jgi:hypothetical protein